MEEHNETRENNSKSLERGLLMAYDVLAQKDAQHPLLGMIERKGDGFVFTSLFDATYVGGTVRRRYEMYTEDLRAA